MTYLNVLMMKSFCKWVIIQNKYKMKFYEIGFLRDWHNFITFQLITSIALHSMDSSLLFLLLIFPLYSFIRHTSWFSSFYHAFEISWAIGWLDFFLSYNSLVSWLIKCFLVFNLSQVSLYSKHVVLTMRPVTTYGTREYMNQFLKKYWTPEKK